MKHIPKSLILATYCIFMLLLSASGEATAHLQNDEYTQILLHLI